MYYLRRKIFIGITFEETIDAKQRISQSACSLFLMAEKLSIPEADGDGDRQTGAAPTDQTSNEDDR